MISGNSKGVNNRHVRFGSITSAGKGCNGQCTYMASHRKSIVKNLIGRKYYFQTFKQKDFEIFLAGQAVLQMSQISRLCVIAFMSYQMFLRIQLNVYILYSEPILMILLRQLTTDCNNNRTDKRFVSRFIKIPRDSRFLDSKFPLGISLFWIPVGVRPLVLATNIW